MTLFFSFCIGFGLGLQDNKSRKWRRFGFVLAAVSCVFLTVSLLKFLFR